MWALGTAKLSVIFFYRSIFRGKAFNIASWTMVGVVMAWIFGAFFAVAFQCGNQFLLLWSSAASVASHCSKGSAVALGFSVPDVITDFLILTLPLYWVSNSQQWWARDAYLARLGNYICPSGGRWVFLGYSFSARCKLFQVPYLSHCTCPW